VVAICDSPQYFGQLKEKLSIITKAWFAQKDFTDLTVLRDFQDSIAKSFRDQEDERDQFFGLSLRELIHEYKYQVLVLFKCLLLQPKVQLAVVGVWYQTDQWQMLFFGTNCERLCMIQFSLISLIPGLIRHLEDCADPAFNAYEENLVMPTSLKTSERASLLSYIGLPLQIFGKGSLFGPYTPLQQLDVLADHDTNSYVVGSTNSLLLDQKDRYSDIFINLDEGVISFSSQPLRAALALTVPDRRWIDFLTQTVYDTWDETNPGRPNTLGYAGSEEFIRLQFEEYLLSLLSAVKYRLYVEKHKDDPKALLHEVDGDPANEFGSDWVKAWMQTENFRVFNKFTDSHIFDIVEPNHPCTGGLTIEDVQRRLAAQVAELHLDERFNSGREVIGKHLATGQARVSEAFNNLWADIEKKREEQRRRAAERQAGAVSGELEGEVETNGRASNGIRYPRAPDLAQAQAAVHAASQKAGAYFSSWGAWASEKRKQGWGRTASGTSQPEKDSSLKRLSLVDRAKSEKESVTPPTGFAADKKERPLSMEKRRSAEKRMSGIPVKLTQDMAGPDTAGSHIAEPVSDAKEENKVIS
jgi:hypothetical protein